MLVYCLIFVMLAILAVEDDIYTFPKAKFILVIIGLFLALFAGFRDVSVSRDYEPYLGSFNAITHGDLTGSGFLPLFEPGFVVIVRFCYFFFVDNAPVVIMLVFALLSMSTKLIAIRKLSFSPFLVLLLYYAHYFMFQEMTQIRNGLACSLFFLAIYFYLREQYLPVFLLILTAFLFHNSAVFYLLLFLIHKDKFNPYIYGSIFVAAIIVGVLKVPFLNLVTGIDFNLISNKLSTYVDYSKKGFFDNVRFFNVLNTVNVLLTGYFFICCVCYKVKDPKFIIFLKCNILSIFMYGALISLPSMAARFAELFGAVFPFLFAYGIQMLPFKKFNVFFLIGVAAIFFYINLIYGQLLNSYHVIPLK